MKITAMKNFSGRKLLAICLVSTSLIGCSKSAEQTKTDNSAANNSESSTPVSVTQANGANEVTMMVGSDITFPPFEYMENNQPKGFDIDIMDAILAENGTKPNYIDTRFSNLIPGLDGKKFENLPILRKVNGKMVEVPASQYRAVRWIVKTLPAQQSTTVSLNAKVQ